MKQHSEYRLAIHLMLVKDDNKVLLLRRFNTGYEDGKYSLVAGHVEKGESIIDAGIREAKEEVGVVILPENLTMCGSMHRKSDDERIDYFGYVKIWENVPYICEKNKCDDLLWAKWDKIPNNTIPYIKEAIQKTFTVTHPNFLWYEEFGWNTYHGLEEARQKDILTKRGIINPDKDLNKVYDDIVESVRKVDQRLEKDSNSDEWINSFKKLIQEQKVLIGTPILRNLNPASNCELSACSIVKPPINRNRQIVLHELETLLSSQLSKGVGIGIDLSSVAEPDKEVDKIDKILFRLDEKQKAERKRPVAAILTLTEQHPRIKEFIKCRNHKDFDKTRLNTSILININDENQDILHDVAKSIYTCGEPGVLFLDQFNNDNDTPQWKYVCTAPCAEIAMADKDACHFSYLNLAAFVDLKGPLGTGRFGFESFINSIQVIVRFLDDIVEYSIEHSSTDRNELVQKKRRIGVGIAGFATALIKMGIPYNSKRGITFAKKITRLLLYYSKLESIELAKRRGSFPALHESKYSDKAWLNGKFPSLNKKDKNKLVSLILKHGIRNATTVAFPPTGTSSQIAGVSPSFEPYFDFAVTFDGHKYLPKEICNYITNRYSQRKSGILIAQLLRNEIDIHKNKEFVIATQIDVKTQLNYTKIFQDASDGSASKTIIVPEETKAPDIEGFLLNAQLKGIKGVSIYRDKCQIRLEKDEC